MLLIETTWMFWEVVFHQEPLEFLLHRVFQLEHQQSVLDSLKFLLGSIEIANQFGTGTIHHMLEQLIRSSSRMCWKICAQLEAVGPCMEEENTQPNKEWYSENSKILGLRMSKIPKQQVLSFHFANHCETISKCNQTFWSNHIGATRLRLVKSMCRKSQGCKTVRWRISCLKKNDRWNEHSQFRTWREKLKPSIVEWQQPSP